MDAADKDAQYDLLYKQFSHLTLAGAEFCTNVTRVKEQLHELVAHVGVVVGTDGDVEAGQARLTKDGLLVAVVALSLGLVGTAFCGHGLAPV